MEVSVGPSVRVLQHQANSSTGTMRPPYYPFVEEIAILGALYGILVGGKLQYWALPGAERLLGAE